MSRFFSEKFSSLTPYVPGEQPKERTYIKLNTNESPFPPSKNVISAVTSEASKLNLYSDPTLYDLVKTASDFFNVDKENIIFSNGSDEVLNFAFMAFCDKNDGIVFPEFTYGFYEVFAELNSIPYTKIPLNSDFTINVNDYIGINKNIVIANPNAPTGIALPLNDIEKIVASNPNNVVIIDEAYVDFGGESAIKLTKKYDNLLVVRTFSKSASLAGARLGFAIGSSELISDLNTIRFSTNPYNVNRMTMVAGIEVFKDYTYYKNNCNAIIKNRQLLTSELKSLGFEVLPSLTNFIFAKNEKISGESLYKCLKEKGVLVRHFKAEKIKNFIRITIGTTEQMNILTSKIKEIFKESGI